MDLKGFKAVNLSPKRQHVSGEILASIQVAKEDNPHFESELTVYRIEKRHYVVLHNNTLPSVKDVYFMEDRDYHKVFLDRWEANLIIKAIMFWDENKKTHINPFTTVAVYCKLNGLDLFERKVFKV